MKIGDFVLSEVGPASSFEQCAGPGCYISEEHPSVNPKVYAFRIDKDTPGLVGENSSWLDSTGGCTSAFARNKLIVFAFG